MGALKVQLITGQYLPTQMIDGVINSCPYLVGSLGWYKHIDRLQADTRGGHFHQYVQDPFNVRVRDERRRIVNILQAQSTL